MTRIHRRTATGNALALSACLLMTLMTFVRPAASADGTDAGRQATVRFDLPAQPLDAALVAFGEVTGYSVLVSSQLAAGRVAAPVRGDYTPAEALQRLLAGTQLGARFSGSNAFTLLALADAPVAPAPVPAEAVPAAPRRSVPARARRAPCPARRATAGRPAGSGRRRPDASGTGRA